MVDMAERDACRTHVRLVPRLFDGVGDGVMAQVAGYVHVRPGCAYLVEHGVAGTGQERDGGDGGVRIATHLDAQCSGHAVGVDLGVNALREHP